MAVCGEQTRENGKNEGDWAFVWDPHGMRWLIARPAEGLEAPLGCGMRQQREHGEARKSGEATRRQQVLRNPM